MSNITSDQPGKSAENDLWTGIPSDFPREGIQAAVAGFQNKLALTEWEGSYYLPGTTPPEVATRFAACNDIARQIKEKAEESKQGKRSHMSEVDILSQYLPRLIAMRWTSEEEARWIIRRVASMLSWEVPPEALEIKTD